MTGPGAGMAAEDGEGDRTAGAASEEAVAAAGCRAGRSLREIAIDLYGSEQVDAEWRAEGWMRVRVRRLVRRGLAEAGGAPRRAGPGTP